MLKLPIKKKVFTQPERTPMGPFEFLFNRYFKHHGWRELYPIRNKYSRVDYFFTSGITGTESETSVVVEYKKRTISVKDFYNSFVEQDKANALLNVAKTLDCRNIYVMEYTDAIVCWMIDPDKQYKQDVMPMPKSDTDASVVLKSIYYLDYKDACLIIGKESNKRRTIDNLIAYRNN